jgi:hypothetical protein
LIVLLASLFIGVMAGQADAAASIHWHKAVRLEPSSDGGVQAVSCPSDRLCVAVDGSGHVLYTTHPTRGAHSWSHPARIDGHNSLTGISCPTIHLCVAVDDSGNVLSSTRPRRGTAGWSRPARIDSVIATDGGYAGLLGVSCPTTSLCTVVDGASAGNVLSTTRPQGGAGAWHSVHLGVPLAGISCPTARLCVAAGAEHVFSTHPSGGRASWHFTGAPVGGGVISSIDCPTTALCVGVGFSNLSPGLTDATSSPEGGSGAWKTRFVLSSTPDNAVGLFDAVGCAGQQLCVALDTADNVFVSTTPVHGGWSGPSPVRANPDSEQNAISCTSALCVVVDSAGVEATGVVRG